MFSSIWNFFTSWGYPIGLVLSVCVLFRDVRRLRAPRTNRHSEWAATLRIDAILFVGFMALASIFTSIFDSTFAFIGIGIMWGLTLPFQIAFVEARANKSSFRNEIGAVFVVLSAISGIIGGLLGPIAVLAVYAQLRQPKK